MENISICIIDNDERYRDALVQYMKSYCCNYVITLSSLDNMIEALIVDSDMVIIDSELLTESNFRLGEYREKIIILSADINTVDANTDGYFIFPRHSNISGLISHINRNICHGNRIGSIGGKDNTKIIVCAGLSGGSGCTTITYCIASQLSRFRESRVFYISLDMFESGRAQIDGKSQEKILYSLIKSDFETDGGTIASNFVETVEGVWRLPVSRHKNLMSELDLNEKKRYIQKLLDGRQFDYLVVDAGNNIDIFAEYLITNAQDTIIIDKSDSVKNHFLDQYEKYVSEITNSDCNVIIAENFVALNGINRLGKGIPIKTCSMANGNKLIDSLELNTDIGKIVDIIG